MKRCLAIIIIVLAAAVSAHAQDIVTTKDGRLIRARVTEVTPELVKYKTEANPDGPLYSLKRSDVKTILYANGMLDNFDSPKAGAAPVSSYISPEAQANAEAKEKAKAEADVKAEADKRPAADEKVYESPAEFIPEARPATPEEIAEAEARAQAEAEAEQPEAEDDYDPWTPQETPIRYDVRYNDIKYDYDTRYYRHQAGDPYSPFWSGFASLCIPGFGQCLDGEWGRGIAFYFGQSAIAFVGLCVLFSPIYDYDVLGNGSDSFGFFRAAGPVILGTLGAEALLSIWSICDAAHIAKVKNMYYQDYDRFASGINFSIEPSFALTPAGYGTLSPSAGVALRLSF
jgi:hypothetical protein